MDNNTENKLTPTQKSEQKFLVSAFKNQLTEQGLEDLRKRFPSDVVLDMTDDEVFKQGRKDRTECNKIVDGIKRRRIDFSNDLKEYGDSLENEVTDIFDNVIVQFEKEDKRRKDEAARIKAAHEKMLDGQRKQLADIKAFVDTAKDTDDTNEISSLIDAVGNIEAEEFHKDIVHEAMEVLKQVNNDLTDILMQKIETNRLVAEAEKSRLEAEEAERVAAEAKRISDEAAAEAKRISDAALLVEETKGKIAERLNRLRMMPLELMGKSATEISRKMTALEDYDVPESEFGDRYQEAVSAKNIVIVQLRQMLNQAEQLESFAAQEAALIPEPEPDYHQPEVIKQEPVDALASVGYASDLINPKREVKKPIGTLRAEVVFWANKYQIQERAYVDLMNIISKHSVN